MKKYIITVFLACFISSLWAQELVMEWQGQTGSDPTGSNILVDDIIDMTDFNDDGVQELTIKDKENNTLVVVNGANWIERWYVPIPNFISFNFEALRCIGFLNLLGNEGLKQAVLAERSGNRWRNVLVIDVSGGYMHFPNSVMIGMGQKDAFDDSAADDDILLYNRDEERVELWGAGK